MPAFVRALFIKSSTEVELSYCIKNGAMLYSHMAPRVPLIVMILFSLPALLLLPCSAPALISQIRE